MPTPTSSIFADLTYSQAAVVGGVLVEEWLEANPRRVAHLYAQPERFWKLAAAGIFLGQEYQGDNPYLGHERLRADFRNCSLAHWLLANSALEESHKKALMLQLYSA